MKKKTLIGIVLAAAAAATAVAVAVKKRGKRAFVEPLEKRALDWGGMPGLSEGDRKVLAAGRMPFSIRPEMR